MLRCYGTVLKNINNVLDVMCPIRELRVSTTKPDWLNNEIIQLMWKRDLAYKRARRTKHLTNWTKAIFLRNRVETFMKKRKKRKKTENLNRNRNNPVRFWKEIRSLVPKDSYAEVTSLTEEETGNVYSSMDLCTHINDYFTNIGKKLADTIIAKNGNKLLLSVTYCSE